MRKHLYYLPRYVCLSVRKFVSSSHTLGFPFWQRLWDLTKRRDDMANMMADMVAHTELDMVADMEVDKVADMMAIMVADNEKNWHQINMEI